LDFHKRSSWPIWFFVTLHATWTHCNFPSQRQMARKISGHAQIPIIGTILLKKNPSTRISQSIFPWIDKIFGTYYFPEEWPENYGLAGERKISPSFLGQTIEPFIGKEKAVLKGLARPRETSLGNCAPVFVAFTRPRCFITFTVINPKSYSDLSWLSRKKPFVVMMIVLQARAESRRYRQPLADVHGVVLFIVIPPVSKCSSVGPIVLNHIYPHRKNSYSNPHHPPPNFRLPTSFHRRKKIKGLCRNCENRNSRPHGKSRTSKFCRRLNFPCTDTASSRDKGFAKKPSSESFIGIPGMVGMFVMQAVAIYPGNRIHVDRERVVHDGDGFHEPFSIVERAVSDSQMKNVSQIQAAKKTSKR